MTIAAAYLRCVQELRVPFGEGEARAMARLLLEKITKIPHAHLVQAERELTSNEQAEIARTLRDLQNSQPLPYVLGRVEFFGLEFRCDRRALIPRGETELLVELALARLKDISLPRIADMGTGTGCIAISLAHERADARVFASDISPDARELAHENAELLNVAARVQFVAGAENNWAAPLLPFAPFDAILSNPPYIATAEIGDLQKSVREFEPHRALDGGDDGLEAYRDIAAQCGALLKPVGFLACELGAAQFDDVSKIFESQNWIVAPPTFDFAGHARVLCASLN